MAGNDSDTLAPRAYNQVNPRLAKVAGWETLFLCFRYALALIYAVLWYAGRAPFDQWGLAVLVTPFLLHNALVHVVALLGRHDLYLHGANLVLHLVQCTILVTLTGAEASPFTIVYFFVLLAQVVYAPHFRHIHAVLFACATAFLISVALHAAVDGAAPSWTRLAVFLMGLALCYGLIRSLANLLYTIELGLQTRAQELASSRATLRTILDSAGGAILVYDENEFITDANAQACDFFKRSRSSLVGLRFRQFIFDDGTLPGKLATLSARGEYQGELLAVLPEGDEFNVSISIRSFLLEGRRFYVALLHDVTEQKHLQEATRKANVRLEQINRELQQVDAMRNAFFGAVSQRLRSPLSAILGYINLLLGEELGTLNAEQRKALQSCRRSVTRVFGLVDEAFEEPGSASAESGPRPAGPSPATSAPEDAAGAGRDS